MLDNQFRGTTQQFLLHFNKQFRRLDELADLSERMPDSIKMAFLQSAVKDISQLSIVDTPDEYTSTTSGVGSFTHFNYSSCYNLLINACARYDATNTSTLPRHHQMTYITYIKSNITKAFQTTILDPEGSCQKDHPSAPKKPFKKSDGPVYVPTEVYKLLSTEAVVALKK